MSMSLEKRSMNDDEILITFHIPGYSKESGLELILDDFSHTLRLIKTVDYKHETLRECGLPDGKWRIDKWSLIYGCLEINIEKVQGEVTIVKIK